MPATPSGFMDKNFGSAFGQIWVWIPAQQFLNCVMWVSQLAAQNLSFFDGEMGLLVELLRLKELIQTQSAEAQERCLVESSHHHSNSVAWGWWGGT